MSKSPSEIIDLMFNNDPFSQWLGIERIEEGEGHCTLQLKVRNEMLNGFSIAHGGITYAIADSALAFASNSYGAQCVSVETSISHTRPLKEGDLITAKTEELSRTNRIGIYQVTVRDKNNNTVALFKGTVYITSKNW